MHLNIVTTNPVIAEVLAEELCEIPEVTAEVIDIVDVEMGCFAPRDHHIVIVTEASIDRWCRWRSRLAHPLSTTQVIGALGSRWLIHESPETRGFTGSIDFKWPARDLVRELDAMRRGPLSADESVEQCSTLTSASPLCHDEIDRRIVAYITMGMSDRDIGAKVFLSSQTVRNRVSRMLERTHVANRTQLAMACMVNPEMLRVQRPEDVSTPRNESIVR